MTGFDPNNWYQSDGRLIRQHVQVNQLQLLYVEVEDARHAGVQRLIVVSTIRQDKATQV